MVFCRARAPSGIYSHAAGDEAQYAGDGAVHGLVAAERDQRHDDADQHGEYLQRRHQHPRHQEHATLLRGGGRRQTSVTGRKSRRHGAPRRRSGEIPSARARTAETSTAAERCRWPQLNAI